MHACVAGVRADPSCEVGWDGCWVLTIVLVYMKNFSIYAILNHSGKRRIMFLNFESLCYNRVALLKRYTSI